MMQVTYGGNSGSPVFNDKNELIGIHFGAVTNENMAVRFKPSIYDFIVSNIEQNPVSGGDVTAKYVDTDGTKISDDIVKSGAVGKSYATDQKSLEGYTFKEVQGSASGNFTDQAQAVTYIYTKDPVFGGEVTAKYVDTNGNKISDDLVKTGNVGNAYTTEQKIIDGYTFKEVQGSASGNFTDQSQTIIYLYMKTKVKLLPISSSNSTYQYAPSKDKDKIYLIQEMTIKNHL